MGEQVAEIFAPAKKITELLDAEPERSPVYLDLLEYLCEKHSTAQIISLVRDRPELAGAPNEDGVVPKPSMFIDKLEAIGAISFDEGWQITPEGKEYVKALH